MTLDRLSLLTPTIAPTEGEQEALNFDCSPDDMDLAVKIAKRIGEEFDAAVAMGQIKAPLGHSLDLMLEVINVMAVHCNGRPLHLLQLLMSDRNDFLHDTSAIHCLLDTRTGKLPDWITLRFEMKRN